MKILVVGMGLIGGSICKSIKATTTHTVDGCDVQPEVLEQALQDGAIDGTGRMEDGTYDMVIRTGGLPVKKRHKQKSPPHVIRGNTGATITQYAL